MTDFAFIFQKWSGILDDQWVLHGVLLQVYLTRNNLRRSILFSQWKVFYQERPGHWGDGNYICKTRKGRIQISTKITGRIYNCIQFIATYIQGGAGKCKAYGKFLTYTRGNDGLKLLQPNLY